MNTEERRYGALSRVKHMERNCISDMECLLFYDQVLKMVITRYILD